MSLRVPAASGEEAIPTGAATSADNGRDYFFPPLAGLVMTKWSVMDCFSRYWWDRNDLFFTNYRHNRSVRVGDIRIWQILPLSFTATGRGKGVFIFLNERMAVSHTQLLQMGTNDLG